MTTLAIPAAIAAGVYAYEPPAELIEYRTEAEQGDTIWSLCARVASDYDNMQELVYRTMKGKTTSRTPGSSSRAR